MGKWAGLALLGATLLFAQYSWAGPGRAATIATSDAGAQNLATYGHASAELGAPGTNFCYVRKGDGPTTYVMGSGLIEIKPTPRKYVRKWGLMAWDECTRAGTITGCEQMEWIYSASAQIEVLAEVALTGGMWKSGDVFAKAQGEFQVWVDGIVRAVEIRECKAGTQDLETNQPVVDGYYDVPAIDGNHVNAGLAALKTTKDRKKSVKAEQKAAIAHGGTSNVDTLTLKYRSLGIVALNVPTNHGWARASVLHDNYDFPANNNGWKIHMEAVDLDDPNQRVVIKAEDYNAWGDK